MIGLAVALLLALPLAARGHIENELSPNRVAVVTVQTAPGASCSVGDPLAGRTFLGTAPASGRLTWRWQPSVWASGLDPLSVRCTEGNAQRSARVQLLLHTLLQVSVIRDYTLHLVYWAPAGDMPAAVAPEMTQLETDVKTSLDAGATDNPFAIPRAYGDSVGDGDPRIASIDSTVDGDAYPKKTADGFCQALSTPCLGRNNLDVEVTRVARQHGWVSGNQSLIMIFTAPSVTVCFTRDACTPRKEACGFHWLTSGGYAYADVVMSGVTARCGGGTAADYAVAVATHEQNEAVVDPLGDGREIADPCEGDLAEVPIDGDTYRLPSLELPDGACAFSYTP